MAEDEPIQQWLQRMGDSFPVSRETSALTLKRLKQNDSSLTQLCVRRMTNEGAARDEAKGVYWPGYYSHMNMDFSRLGEALESNTHVHTLNIYLTRDLANSIEGNEAFFRGIGRSSIKTLFTGGSFREEIECNVLGEIVASLGSLRRISLPIYLWQLSAGHAALLASALGRCPTRALLELYVGGPREDIEQLLSKLRGLHQRTELRFDADISMQPLASLLQDPNCHLTSLTFGHHTTVDDSWAEVMAHSLRGKSRLARLCLKGDIAVSGNGWDAISSVLCDTSSANATFASNHTLNDIDAARRQPLRLPTTLSSLLALNRDEDKKRVAAKKIFRFHSHLDMEPFLEWDLKVLPVAIAWFDTAKGYAGDEEGNVDAKKLSSIYQFARALPLMVLPSPSC